MNSCIVLLFHSIDERNPASLRNLGNIRPAIFEKFLNTVKREFDIVTLKEVADYISGNVRGNERILALTFDDGAKSYATNAVPLMSGLGIHSACFLITGCIGGRALYWRYLYNYCVSKGYGRRLSVILESEYNEPVRENEVISFTRARYDSNKTDRIVNRILRDIISEEEYRESEGELFLSYDDIESLKQNQMVTFGVHTRSHPVMNYLSDDEIGDELSSTIAFFNEHIGKDVPIFSIPFGRLYSDYDERTITAALRLSFKYIFSAYGGSNERGQPLHNIRRITVDEKILEQGVDSFVRELVQADVREEYVLREKRLKNALSGLNIV